MLLKSELNKLKTKLNSNGILSKSEECCCYAEDALNTRDKKRNPDLVVFVETVEDIQFILKYAYEHEIPVIARGAGTNMVGACTCPNGGIVLNFTKMNKILNIEPANMTVTVQSGVVLGELKQETDNFGLFFPPDPSNYKVSTIGGAIAQSSGGALSFKYGTIKDYVLSLKVVTAKGEIMTIGSGTIKDATGYHLAQLMVGSEGTLAVIAEATLKLIPKPETRRSLLAYFENIEDVVFAVDNLVTSNIFPSAIDFMDKNSIITVENFSKCGLRTEYSGVLFVELDGQISSMNEQLDKTKEILENSNVKNIRVAKDEAESELLWQARRVSYAATTALAPDVISDDIIVPRKNLGRMVNKCHEIAEKYNLKMCLIGHVGDGNLHPQIALNLDDDIEFKNCMDAKAEMYKFAIQLGGTLSGEHGIGIEKKEYMANSVDITAVEYMKAIKKIFDTKNILNPGKIF
ncbi:MAG: FAD-binding protein [bacterium]|nr:FAD-binding protein [bacterium]